MKILFIIRLILQLLSIQLCVPTFLSVSLFTGAFGLQFSNFTGLYLPLSSCNKHGFLTSKLENHQRVCYFSDELPWNCISLGEYFTTNKISEFATENSYYNISLLCISRSYEIKVLSIFIRDYDMYDFPREWIELISPNEGIVPISSILIINLYGHHVQPIHDYMRITPVTQSSNSIAIIPFQSIIQFSLDADCLGTLIFEVTPIIGGIEGRKGLTTHFYFEVVLHGIEATNARSYFNPLITLELSKSIGKNFEYALTTPWSIGLSTCLIDSTNINKISYQKINNNNNNNNNIPSTDKISSDVISLDGIHIMYVSGGVFDGQLKIFVDQWNGLASLGVTLSLLWVCGIDAECVVDNVMLKLLDEYPFVTLVKLPIITVQKYSLSQRPNNTSRSFYELHHITFDEITQDVIYTYVVERLQLVNYHIHQVQPVWVYEVWIKWLEVISPLSPDIIVIGNTATPSDIIAPSLGRAAGAKAFVLELASSVSPPHRLLEYTITVSPSHYAYCTFQSNMASIHTTLTTSSSTFCSNNNSDDDNSSSSSVGYNNRECHETVVVPVAVPGFIIPPGINLTYFDYYLQHQHPECFDLCKYSPHSSSSSTSSNDTRIPNTIQPLNNTSTGVDDLSTTSTTATTTTSTGTPSRTIRCSEDCLVVGFVGRLVPVKGCGMFLLAAEIITKTFHNVQFMIVGSGPLRPYLEEMADRLRISSRVRFLGQATHPRIISLYASMDIIVSLSQNRMETFMIVNIEAMAASIPIVSFGTYGQGENLTPPDIPFEEANAIIVLEATPEAVANAISLLLSNDTLSHIIGLNGRKTVERLFTVETMLSGYSKAYSEALRLSTKI